MDPVRFGSDVRLLRRRGGWSQRRLAAEAKVSRYSVAAVEAGRGHRLPLEQLIAIVAAVGGYLSVRILFQGEALDRLRDRRHAALVEAMVTRLQSDGWDVATEVSFNSFGERGSIDILGFHAATRTLLVIEVKSVVPDIGGSLATLDRKVRLARELAQARGWDPRAVARLLVMPEASTIRRRIAAHEATFANAFPARNVEVNRWLRAPVGSISGLIFLSTARVRCTRQRSSGVGNLEDRRPRTSPRPVPIK
jgi:transcriptional regulator with XRE-family HTH domain